MAMGLGGRQQKIYLLKKVIMVPFPEVNTIVVTFVVWLCAIC